MTPFILTHIPNKYILIVHDKDIAQGGQYGYLDRIGNYDQFLHKMSHGDRTIQLKKVLAHLPLYNSPILEGVSLLPKIPIRTFIKSKLPTKFETEMECADIDMSSQGGPYIGQYYISIKLNEQNIPVWQGKYIYN